MTNTSSSPSIKGNETPSGMRGGDVVLPDREASLHCARVYLTESRRRGRQPFAFVLLEWAGNARRRAAMGQQRLFA